MNGHDAIAAAWLLYVAVLFGCAIAIFWFLIAEFIHHLRAAEEEKRNRK